MARKDTDNRLSQIPMFSDLSRRELRSVGSLMTEQHYTAGEVLIEQDTVGRECMIVVEGQAIVRRNGRKIATVEVGDIMGELSILSGNPRSATVVAGTDMIVEVMNRRELMSLLDESPKLAKKILLHAITVLHDLASKHHS